MLSKNILHFSKLNLFILAPLFQNYNININDILNLYIQTDKYYTFNSYHTGFIIEIFSEYLELIFLRYLNKFNLDLTNCNSRTSLLC